MIDDEKEARYYFLRDNPHCLVDVAANADVADLVRRLAASGDLPMTAILERISSSACPDFFFGALFDQVDRNLAMRLELINALVRKRRGGWLSDAFDPRMVGKKFDLACDFVSLIEFNREVLLDADDDSRPEFLNYIDPNPYWNVMVIDRIERRDYKRAWDELKKARYGLFIGTKADSLRMALRVRDGQARDASLYRYMAGYLTWRQLSLRLFTAMVEAGKFTRQTSVAEDAFRAMDKHFGGSRDARRKEKRRQAAKAASAK